MREGFEVFSHSVRAVAVVGFSPPVIGDREKPGARLDCFCFGAHRGIQRDSGSGGHSRARSAPPPSLAPGFSRSPLRSSRIRSIIRYGYAQRGTPTRIAASVTRKIGSNHDELLVGLYEQQGHLLTLDRLTWMLSKSATDPRGTR